MLNSLTNMTQKSKCARRGPGKPFVSHKPEREAEHNRLDIRYRFIEEELKKLNSQNQVLIMQVGRIAEELARLNLQLLQTLKGLAALKGEDYIPSSPSEQQVIDHIKNHGARVVRDTKTRA